MMKEKKLSQMILKLHDRAEAAKYDGDSSPPYQEVEMLNFHDEESVVHTVLPHGRAGLHRPHGGQFPADRFCQGAGADSR